MTPPPRTPEPPTRRSCESCRRRKARCTAERPICAACQRANQQCVYLLRDRARPAARVDKVTRKNSKERVQNIESQISNIYTILNSLTKSTVESSISPSRANRDDAIGHGSGPDTARSGGTRSIGVRSSSATDVNESEPSLTILKQAVDVYQTKIHLQPLPLFNLQGLSDRIAEASAFLRSSFLALCLHLSPPMILAEQDPDAAQRHSQWSHETVARLVSEGAATLEVLQALCLLALIDMKVGEPARGWMMIGMASRLQAFRTLTRSRLGAAHEDEEHRVRCHWSILILEKAFGPQPGGFERFETPPKDVPSAPWPPPLIEERDKNQATGTSGIGEANQGLGILVACFGLISVWGGISSYLHELRSGRAESPWLPTSTSVRLNLQLFEWEARLWPRHLLRNVAFVGRSAAELLEHREYWAPWAFMQIAAHAVRAILNHPFLHLVNTHDNSRITKPMAYLQQTVDAALYNSSWVARLLRIFDSLPFEMIDPLLGHLVAGTATVLWFFQFTRDSKISLRAKEDLDKCERFLERLSTIWPHLVQKLKLLQELQAKVQDGRYERSGESTTVSFRPSVIWALLDSTITSMTAADSPQTILDPDTDFDDAASVCLTLHFTHPLVENHDERAPSPSNPMDDMFSHGTGAIDLFPDSLFAQSALDADQWLYDMA